MPIIGNIRAAQRSAADVKDRCPRIMTALSAKTGFREPQNNPAKIDLAIKTLELAQQYQIQLLVLPAGFLTVTTCAEILPAVHPIIRTAKKYGISLIVGVDLSEIRSYRSSDGGKMLAAVKTGTIPLFLVVFDATTGKVGLHRQRSCTSFQARQRMVPDEAMTPKTIDISGSTVQIVFCGEVYQNEKLFGEMAPRTALVVAHTAMPRLTKTLKAKGRKGFSVIHSEHRVGRGGTLFCIDRETDRSQQATLHVEGNNGLWLEAALWEVTDKGRIRPARPE